MYCLKIVLGIVNMDVLLVMIPVCCLWLGLILFLQRKFKAKWKTNNDTYNSIRSNSINSHNDWQETRRTSSAYSYLPYNVNHISRD